MTPIQEDSFKEGMIFIRSSFSSRTPLNMHELCSWINTRSSNDHTTYSKKTIYERDDEGNLISSTNYEIGKTEASGYRLLGAFTAMENIRVAMDMKNITYSFTEPT